MTDTMKRLVRIKNLAGMGYDAAAADEPDFVRSAVTNILVTVWELARDLDPQILIDAGTLTKPRGSDVA